MLFAPFSARKVQILKWRHSPPIRSSSVGVRRSECKRLDWGHLLAGWGQTPSTLGCLAEDVAKICSLSTGSMGRNSLLDRSNVRTTKNKRMYVPSHDGISFGGCSRTRGPLGAYYLFFDWSKSVCVRWSEQAHLKYWGQ